MKARSTEQLRRVAASVVIVGVLTLQVVVANPFARLIRGRDGYLWPFLTYPMYDRPHYPGEAVHQYHLVGVLAGGRDVEIAPEDLNLNFWEFLWGPLKAMLHNETTAIRQYADFYQDKHWERLHGLRLTDEPVLVTREGPRPGTRQIVATAWLTGAGGAQ